MFADIVTFIGREVRITTDPVFGDIQDAPVIGAFKESGRAKPVPRPKARGSSFATTFTTVERDAHWENRVKDGPEKTCLFCKKGRHTLESCFLLEKKAHSEKMEFLKKNGVCFGCLCTGHISKECRKRLSCKTCGSRHPSWLHIHSKENGDPEKGRSNSDRAVDSALVEVQTGGLTGAGEQDCKLAIVPVKVKSSKGQRSVETYAFLDPGSSASF